MWWRVELCFGTPSSGLSLRQVFFGKTPWVEWSLALVTGQNHYLGGQRFHHHSERMEDVLVLLFSVLLVVFLIMRKAAIKAFSKSYELPPAQDIHKQQQEWPQLRRIHRGVGDKPLPFFDARLLRPRRSGSPTQTTEDN
tara:strand:+ start:148 stop:564 length:417 start_codon:yes stop_codon:yes gene_type:complete